MKLNRLATGQPERTIAALRRDVGELDQLRKCDPPRKLDESPQLGIADGFLMMGDYFHWLLTGKRSVEYSNASTTSMLDPRTGDWAWDLIDRFGLSRALFGPIAQPGTTLGPVQPSVARETGLEAVPVILPATHDTASAVIAAPADSFAPANPDWCYISSGTWSLMGCELPHPLINETCSALNFTNEGGVQGSTRLLKNIGGLWIFQQIRASLDRRGEAVSWDAMVQAARQSSPFSLLLDPDHPDFRAPDDMVEAIAAFAARTGQPPVTDPAVLYRAALEGLALRYRVCLGMLESLVGNRIETIHVMGGGSLNKLLCQMTADACQRTVIAGPVEATATGNVLMQMIGCGEIDSVAQARQLVQNSFTLTRYTPQETDSWDQVVDRFKALAAG
jgi:rhamnulokinase